MTHVTRGQAEIEQNGLHVIPWNLSRGSLNPFREIVAFLQVLRAYRSVRPDLVHHVTLKSVVYGGMAARLCGIATINAVTGLGHVFTAQSRKMRVVGHLLRPVLRICMRRSGAHGIFQNPEDMEALVSRSVIKRSSCTLIRGSGVDTEEFRPKPEPNGVPVVILATRMLWDKGVGIFVEAARRLRSAGVSARFVLVGDPDPENPSSIPKEQLVEWHTQGIVEWWPRRRDMPQIFAGCSVVCFPSHYGEGVPKVLLEAAACGRATITTNAPGCREAVRQGENGLLVPMRDSIKLADAISELVGNPDLRSRMGRRGREMVLREFAIEHVISETFKVYRSVLNSEWPQLRTASKAAVSG